MSESKITNQKLWAELSDAERRGLKALAANQGVPLQRMIGWVLRCYLNENGLPTERSVKT